VDDFTAWLRQQIEARLTRARALAAATGDTWAATRNDDFDYTVHAKADIGVVAAEPVLDTWREDVAAWAEANDPRDTIARCEAELGTLNTHYILHREDRSEDYEEFSVVHIGGANQDYGCVTCHYYGQGGVKGYGYCRTVRLLGSAYKHQPGYREEWAPLTPAIRLSP
jgi:Family of unknown function (DUF6221)